MAQSDVMCSFLTRRSAHHKAKPTSRTKCASRSACGTHRSKNEKSSPNGLLSFLVAEMGFEPHDLRVMSPTSYQAALLRDIGNGAGNGNRTRTILSYHGILSPGRLPISPFRRFRAPMPVSFSLYIIAPLIEVVNTFLKKAEKFFCLLQGEDKAHF